MSKTLLPLPKAQHNTFAWAKNLLVYSWVCKAAPAAAGSAAGGAAAAATGRAANSSAAASAAAAGTAGTGSGASTCNHTGPLNAGQ